MSRNRKLKLALVLYVLFDVLVGYGGFIPLLEAQGATQPWSLSASVPTQIPPCCSGSFAVEELPSMVYIPAGTNLANGGVQQVGTTLLARRVGATHGSDRGLMILASSTDQATWNFYTGANFCQAGDQSNVGCFIGDANANNDVEGPNFVLTPDGRVLFFYYQYNFSTTNFGQIFKTQSLDGGKSWSTPVALTATGVTLTGGVTTGPVIYGPPIVIGPAGPGTTCPNGCIMANVMDNSTDKWLIFSLDNGATWTVSKRYSIGTATAPTEEQQWIWTGGANLLGYGRNVQVTGPCAAAGGPLIQFSSSNLGTSFTVANTNLSVVPNQPLYPCSVYTEISPQLIDPKLPDFSTLLFWGERQQSNSPNADGGGRLYNYVRAITFQPATAIAGPTTFGMGQLLQTAYPTIGTGSSVGFGYPNLVRFRDYPAQFLVVYWAQSPGSNNFRLWQFTAGYGCTPKAVDCSQ